MKVPILNVMGYVITFRSIYKTMIDSKRGSYFPMKLVIL